MKDFGITGSGVVKGELVEDLLTSAFDLTREEALEVVLSEVRAFKKVKDFV